MVRGVLIEEANKAGAGAEVSVGDTEVRAVEPAFGSVGGIVASIADPGSAEFRNQSGLLEERNFLWRNIQIRDQNFAKTVTNEERSCVRLLVGKLDGAFVVGFCEGVDVARSLGK